MFQMWMMYYVKSVVSFYYRHFLHLFPISWRHLLPTIILDVFLIKFLAIFLFFSRKCGECTINRGLSQSILLTIKISATEILFFTAIAGNPHKFLFFQLIEAFTVPNQQEVDYKTEEGRVGCFCLVADLPICLASCFHHHKIQDKTSISLLWLLTDFPQVQPFQCKEIFYQQNLSTFCFCTWKM